MGHQSIEPNPWMILPFGLLLGTIALAPVWAREWWLKHYPKVAYSLGAITLAYYLFGLHAYERVLHVGHEYVSFIVLIGSLYVVSGGIHINVKGEATPHEQHRCSCSWARCWPTSWAPPAPRCCSSGPGFG